MSASTKQFTLFDHLLELRTRLLKAVVAVLVVFCSMIYFANDIYEYGVIAIARNNAGRRTNDCNRCSVFIFRPF